MAQLKVGSTVGGILICSNPMTNEGDLIYGGASGLPTRLPAPVEGRILEFGPASTPQWINRGVAQVVYNISGDLFTVPYNPQIPIDNTIPQITEGTQWLTCTITPKKDSNNLHIRTFINYSVPLEPWGSDYFTPYTHKCEGLVAALFNGTANALAGTVLPIALHLDGNKIVFTTGTGATEYKSLDRVGAINHGEFEHIMSAGTVGSITFSVRVCSTMFAEVPSWPLPTYTYYDMYINGQKTGTQLFGGASQSGIIITEYRN